MCFLVPPEPEELGGEEGVVDDVVVVGGGVLVEVVPVVTVTDGVVLVDVEGVQLDETSVSPGGTSDEGGVPGAALTVSVVVPPTGSPTVSVHVSADAIGIAASPIVVSVKPTVMTSILSLRTLDTLVYLLPPWPVRTWPSPHPGGGEGGKLTGGQIDCNAEPSCEWGLSGRDWCSIETGRGEAVVKLPRVAIGVKIGPWRRAL